MKLTKTKQVEIKRKADKLIKATIDSYTIGNNSGKDAIAAMYDELIEQDVKELEALLKPYNISLIWPGLYPIYILNGEQYHVLIDALAVIE